MDINWIPLDSIGSNDFPSLDVTDWPETPKILGMLGPYISASNKPTLEPDFDRDIARLLLTVDFPTPPFPEAIAMIFVFVFKTYFESFRLIFLKIDSPQLILSSL